MTIIQRIIDLLDKNSLKAADLCRYIDVSTSTMTNWKQRGTDPPANKIIPICEFFNVDSVFLLTGETHRSEDISSSDRELLFYWHQLPHDTQLELKGEIKGYLKCLAKQQETAAEEEERIKQAK